MIIEFAHDGGKVQHDDTTFQTYTDGNCKSPVTQEIVAKAAKMYRDTLPKPEKLKLNVGCGFRPFSGYVNLDYDEMVHPDVVRSVDDGLPFDDNKFNEVYTSHVIEHITDVFLFMSEIWRVTEKGGKVTIICPNGHNMFSSIEPDHKRQISWRYFDRWRPEHRSVQNELKQLLGAQFNYISRELINNEMELKFVLTVVK